MIVIYVAVNTQDHTAAEFERIIREIQADVRQMEGCVKNEWFCDPDIPLRYVMYGEFDSPATFEKYLNSAIVKRIGDELMPLLAAPPEFKHYSAAIFDGNG
ncbi:MAG: hypothetical protein BroJett018_33840 [Chloroflexota bacterium]|nr:MAG: hypothetical protein BroJett018_33840 [Chloroflexota bacterium]